MVQHRRGDALAGLSPVVVGRGRLTRLVQLLGLDLATRATRNLQKPGKKTHNFPGENVESHGKSWKVMESHGKSWEVMGSTMGSHGFYVGYVPLKPIDSMTGGHKV